MGDTPERILAAARHLLVHEGPRAVSMRRVAERVGISATAIYRHFPDKDALVGEVVAEGSAALVRALSRAVKEATPEARLLATGRAYLRFAFRHPEYYRVLFMARDEAPAAPARGRDAPGGGAAFRFLVERVTECVASRALPPGTDPVEAALLCWSVCHGLASLWLGGGGQQAMPAGAYEKLADRVLARTLTGLAARP